jgi:hypothetical protein
MKPQLIKEQPFETQGHDFSGMASLDLHDTDAFYTFLASVAEYDPDRYDPVALKVYIAENHPSVTLYVVDKNAQETGTYPKDKLPVRKLHLQLMWGELFSFIRRFDLVVTPKTYDVQDMLVIND